MTTDDRTTALAAARCRVERHRHAIWPRHPGSTCWRSKAWALNFDRALPSDWCGHEAEVARLKGLVMVYRPVYENLVANGEPIRKALADLDR